MDVVRFLAEECGPRPAAGPTEERVLEYLADHLTGIGLDVRRQRFSFRSWEASGVWTLTVSHDGSDARHVRAVPLPYTNINSAAALVGTIEWEGEWPLIPGRLTCPRFAVLDENRRVVGAIVGYPGGEARPLPNPHPIMALPTVVISGPEADALRKSLERTGHSLHVNIELGASREGLERSVNLIAEEPSSTPWLTIIAHYDSLADSPGANDNAAGVSLLLRLAERAAAERDGRPRFVLVGAEEPFIAGSRAYVAAAGTSGELGHCRAALNLDMVAVGDRFAVRCTPGSPWDHAAQRLPSHTDAGTPIARTDLYQSSDHWAFHEAGVPSAQLTREPDGAWHLPGDLAERVHPGALDEAESVAIALIEEIDSTMTRGGGHV